MTAKELCSIREWAPLTIVERLPRKQLRLGGLFPVDVNITCIAAISNFIALGSEAGVVFWYNRQTGDVQKLRAEVTSRITCVRIINSVEYMVAAGSSTGQVSVFQIQKELPPDLNLPFMRVKPIQRYTIRDLHTSSISCCEWSRNGMKLFTGDRQGVVVLTEFDYVNHLSKSAEIISEAYEIVQLSLHQRYLLVSTLYRSIVCQRNQSNGQWRVLQVGKKDRKQLIDCGGIFLKRSEGNVNEPQLICGRPGLRFWLADTDGNVEKTLIFREAVENSPTWEIPILNPKNQPNSMQRSSCAAATDFDATSTICDSRNFHELYLYAGQDSLVVTHDDATLYILNLNRLRVEGAARGFRKILDFCVCDHEIFVLEGGRSLVRLAPMPEKPNKTAKIIFNTHMPPPVPHLGCTNCGKFESPVEYEPDSESIIRAEECFELPPIESLNLNIPIELAVESPRAEQNRRLEIFNKISSLEFDQPILHHSGISTSERKKRRKSRDHQKSQGIVEIGQVALRNDSDVLQSNLTKSDNMVTEGKNELQQHQLEKEIESDADVPKTYHKITKPTEMEASLCIPTTSSGATQDIFTSQSPVLEEPNSCENSLPRRVLSLAEELALSLPPQKHSRVARLDSKDCVFDKCESAVATYPPPPPTTPATTSALVYPKEPILEDAAVQTTPKHTFYINQLGECDYSDGQPVDDICSSIQTRQLLAENIAINENAPPQVVEPLRFVPAQPMLNDDVGSFLLEFSRASDPMRRSNTPPVQTDTHTSSEWEFLDN